MQYIQLLLLEFEKHSNPSIAVGQKNYLKNQFDFFGIKTTKRREIQKPFLDKNYLPDKKMLPTIVQTLWDKPQRECQYFAQELSHLYAKRLEEEDMALYEFMITHKSWWDTVDFIATTLVGNYFKVYPNHKIPYSNKWLASGNIWLQRTAVLFQLKFKKELDTVLLENTIQSLIPSKEFFINKAIGWVLREYSKTNPKWVNAFINRTYLSSLSQREAQKYL